MRKVRLYPDSRLRRADKDSANTILYPDSRLRRESFAFPAPTGSGTASVSGSLSATLAALTLVASGTVGSSTPVTPTGGAMWLREYARRRYEEEELLVLNG
jgi:hypothetical protein